MLGDDCAYQVVATTLGGLSEIADLTDSCTDLVWDRKQSTTTVATATLQKRAGAPQPTINGAAIEQDCCARIARLTTVEQEFEIRRGGEVVWAGPLAVIDEGRGDVKLKAVDQSVWFRQWRTVPVAYTAPLDPVSSKPTRDLDDVWHDIASLALAAGPTGLALVAGTKIGVPAARAILPSKQIAASDIDELTRTGRPWTMLGRGLEFDAALHPAVQLSEDDFIGDLRVIESGEQWASRVTVNGNGNVQAIWGGANPAGLVKDIIVNETTIMDTTSALNAAQRRWAEGGGDIPLPSVVVPSGAQLATTADVAMSNLIPGCSIDVRLASFCSVDVTVARFALVEVSVHVTGGSSSAVETIAVSVSQLIDDSNTSGTST